MNREEPPSEDEQYVALKEIVVGMEGAPVTVRTLDVGSDKLAYSLGEHIAPSVNPALGLRAIRLSLKTPALLEAQIAAILRAGAHGPVRILVPMITSVDEIRHVRKAVDKMVRRLTRKRVAIAEAPPLGVMIETPGAALAADALADACDFFSLGTNDLTMYTLAIDRGDEQVAHLYDPLHPAVLRLICFATEAARRAGIPVNLCGELAGNPRFTAMLLGFGLRDLSMAPPNVPRVKQRILALDAAAAARHAEELLGQSEAGRIAKLIDTFSNGFLSARMSGGDKLDACCEPPAAMLQAAPAADRMSSALEGGQGTKNDGRRRLQGERHLARRVGPQGNRYRRDRDAGADGAPFRVRRVARCWPARVSPAACT